MFVVVFRTAFLDPPLILFSMVIKFVCFCFLGQPFLCGYPPPPILFSIVIKFVCYCFFRTAFPLWILTLILFSMVIKFGAYFMMMTGGCLLIGTALYGGIRNSNALVIPFTDENILRFHWGWCFWLNLVAGMSNLYFQNILMYTQMWPIQTISTPVSHTIAIRI